MIPISSIYESRNEDLIEKFQKNTMQNVICLSYYYVAGGRNTAGASSSTDNQSALKSSCCYFYPHMPMHTYTGY